MQPFPYVKFCYKYCSYTYISKNIWYNIRVGQEKSNLQQLENLINFSAMKPKARYTFSGVQSLNLSDYGISISLTDGDSIEFDVRSDAFKPLLVDAIESYIRWNAKDDTKQKLAKRLVKEMEVSES